MKMPWIAFNYDMTKAMLVVLKFHKERLRGHVFCIGPLAFCVMWAEPEARP